jgi:hypothetical protein
MALKMRLVMVMVSLTVGQHLSDGQISLKFLQMYILLSLSKQERLHSVPATHLQDTFT